MAKPLLAINISKRRKAKGWTQSDLAEHVGVHVNTIKDLERGLSEGRPDTRQAIATALGCEVWDLMSPPRTQSTGSDPKSDPFTREDLQSIIRAELSAHPAASPASEDDRRKIETFDQLVQIFGVDGITRLLSADPVTVRSIDRVIGVQHRPPSLRTSSQKREDLDQLKSSQSSVGLKKARAQKE